MVRISDLFIPPLCQHCHAKQWGGAPLCLSCLKSLQPFGEHDGSHGIGESSLGPDFLFTRSWFLFPMTAPLLVLIHGFKYRHFKRNIPFLLRYLAYRPQLIASVKTFDAIVPIPLHKARKRERGYNQAALIAKELSKLTGVPVLPNALARFRNTPSQTKLTREERQKNLESAISCVKPLLVRGKKILLVDDVFTTGATMELCAEVLLASGCAELAIFAIAKVRPPGKKPDFALELAEANGQTPEIASGFLI